MKFHVHVIALVFKLARALLSVDPSDIGILAVKIFCEHVPHTSLKLATDASIIIIESLFMTAALDYNLVMLHADQHYN